MSIKKAVIITSESSKNSSEFQYLNNQLKCKNFTVEELAILDEKNISALATKMQEFLKNYFIFILSTDNNFIFEVLSKVFDEKLVENNHLASIYNVNVREIFKIPNNSKILQIQNNHVNGITPACINLHNVFVLPNVLNSIKMIYEKLISPFLSYDNNALSKHFILSCTQNGVEQLLIETLDKIKDSCDIIKFCTVNNDICEQNVIIYNTDIKELTKCVSVFKNSIPKNIIMNENINNSVFMRLETLKKESYVCQALKVLSTCYNDYNPETVFLSFNGGKDCTVLLFLTLFVLKRIHPNYKAPLLCLYIQPENPFKEVEDFIEQCKLLYNMELVTIRNNVKDGLIEIMKEQPHLKACLMGTRRTDPYADKLNYFTMCDPGWPQIMRVCPVLDWTYSEIWEFILNSEIPYCHLYDLGYTSLGSTTNTIQNPDLTVTDEKTGVVNYRPAYHLKDGNKERNGRIK